MFIGFVDGNQGLYTRLQEAGFILVFKPTVRFVDHGKETRKGNVDAELVLHAAAIEYQYYDKALIISGDGDFACLVEFLASRGKLLHVCTPNQRYSKLLKPYSQYIIRMDSFKESVCKTKDRHRRSVETLGLSGHDDK